MTEADDKAVEVVAIVIINASERTTGFGERFIPAALSAEHSGDCTKDPWSCSRCYAEEHMDIARAAIAAYKAHLEAEGMVVVPTEAVKGHRFVPHKGRSVCLDCGEYEDEAGPACFESFKAEPDPHGGESG